jgi:PqqD family protein of HPr-rel-A system
LVVHEVEGEGLVFDPRSGDTHRLNETAWFIWGRCNGHKTALDMARIVSEVYAVSAEEAVGHVERILADFGERGLFAEPDPR